MSTPEERMKQLADQLEATHRRQKQGQADASAREREDRDRRSGDAATEAQGWLNRAQNLVDATQKRIPVFLEQTLEGPGFELRVGMARFRAILDSDGWRVVSISPDSLHPITGLHTNLPALREQLVERMVEQGLHDLYGGRV